MLEAALVFRNKHGRTYGLDLERSATMPWPAATYLAEQGVYFFDECARTGNNVVPQSEIKDVLENLATVVCEIYKLRIIATKSLQPHKAAELQEDFIRTRREMWGTLGMLYFIANTSLLMKIATTLSRTGLCRTCLYFSRRLCRF